MENFSAKERSSDFTHHHLFRHFTIADCTDQQQKQHSHYSPRKYIISIFHFCSVGNSRLLFSSSSSSNFSVLSKLLSALNTKHCSLHSTTQLDITRTSFIVLANELQLLPKVHCCCCWWCRHSRQSWNIREFCRSVISSFKYNPHHFGQVATVHHHHHQPKSDIAPVWPIGAVKAWSAQIPATTTARGTIWHSPSPKYHWILYLGGKKKKGWSPASVNQSDLCAISLYLSIWNRPWITGH